MAYKLGRGSVFTICMIWHFSFSFCILQNIFFKRTNLGYAALFEVNEKQILLMPQGTVKLVNNKLGYNEQMLGQICHFSSQINPVITNGCSLVVRYNRV
jgi:hypothetical protein